MRKVRVFINPKSGVSSAVGAVEKVLTRTWDVDGIALTYQISKDVEDGRRKTRRAIEEGVDTVLVVGGDGMVNSIGGELIGSSVALGVIPAGSGNGFARHFGIPLTPAAAARALKRAQRRAIDVGTVNGRPFFVTCSLAWDGALVRTFDRSPVRGVLPYVFAAAYEYLGYEPQPFTVSVDDQPPRAFPDPVVFTIANLTQYGGGARIAPSARADDGLLELVTVAQRDAAMVLPNLGKLFDGRIDTVPQVTTLHFSRMVVRRARPAPIQFDGELTDAPEEVDVRVLPKALTVLEPADRQNT